MENFSKELIGASSIPIILSLLSRQESYGYEIIKNIKEISNEKIDFKEGTLYPVLHKLEKKGYIESFWKESDAGRKRKYYKITDKGKKQLSSEQQSWNVINHIMSKLWNQQPKTA